jgi:hypothetical protein
MAAGGTAVCQYLRATPISPSSASRLPEAATVTTVSVVSAGCGAGVCMAVSVVGVVSAGCGAGVCMTVSVVGVVSVVDVVGVVDAVSVALCSRIRMLANLLKAG